MVKQANRKLRNIHPGEVLREEFLIPLGVAQYRLAKEIGVTEARISAICSGKRAITADTALRLAAFFGTTSGFWLGLQSDYDMGESAKTMLSVFAQGEADVKNNRLTEQQKVFCSLRESLLSKLA